MLLGVFKKVNILSKTPRETLDDTLVIGKKSHLDALNAY